MADDHETAPAPVRPLPVKPTGDMADKLTALFGEQWQEWSDGEVGAAAFTVQRMASAGLRTAAQEFSAVAGADADLAALGLPESWISSIRALRAALAEPEPPMFVPDEFDADALVVILGLADMEPLERAGEPPVRCALCGAEAPGGATTLAPTQHLGGCLWTLARELAEVVRGDPKTP